MSDRTDSRLDRRSVLKLAGGTAAAGAFGAVGVGSDVAEVDLGPVERLQAAVGGFTTGEPTTVTAGATRITRLPTDVGPVTQFAGPGVTALTSQTLVSDAAIREQVGLSNLDRFETDPFVVVLADDTTVTYARSSVAHRFVSGTNLSVFLPSEGVVGLASTTTDGVELDSLRTARLSDDGVRPGPVFQTESQEKQCRWVGDAAKTCAAAARVAKFGSQVSQATACAAGFVGSAVYSAFGKDECNPW